VNATGSDVNFGLEDAVRVLEKLAMQGNRQYCQEFDLPE